MRVQGDRDLLQGHADALHLKLRVEVIKLLLVVDVLQFSAVNYSQATKLRL